MSLPFTLTEREQKILSHYARESITQGLKGVVVGHVLLEDPRCESLCVPRGCFVTLRIDGGLRGCIGTMQATGPLYQNVAHMAYEAAFRDPRFSPLTAAEWKNTRCEISVLGPLSRCPSIGAIILGRHGLLLQKGGQSGVFLPEVPLEVGWTLEQYLDNLCVKADLPLGSYSAPDAHLYWFESYIFEA